MNKNLVFVSKDNQKVKIEIRTRPRDSNKKTLDWETLEPVTDGLELSICGDCGRSSGQIYDDFEPTEAQAKLVEFWKKYHLNGLCSGTKKQMEALEDFKPNTGCYRDYYEECEYLKSEGLYEDRGYKFGTGWLFKSFPMDELEQIIAEIEREEEERTADFDEMDLSDDDEALEYIREHTDINPAHVLALLRNLNLSVSEISAIEETSKNTYKVYGTGYYVGPEEELSEIAREHIDRSMWVDAVNGGYTDQGFDDWVDSIIEEDLGGILNSWDGTLDSEFIDGTEYLICRG